MEKLFDAIRNQHPGFEVVDVKFLVNPLEVDGQDAEALDIEFAKAINEADGPLAGVRSQ